MRLCRRSAFVSLCGGLLLLANFNWAQTPIIQPSAEGGSLKLQPQTDLIANADLPETSTAIVPVTRIDLFNGKDLDDWKIISRSNEPVAGTWTVTNGVIHCAGNPTGYARTKQGYRDYKLTVEWRFVKVAPKADNTGILVHMQSPDEVWPRCVQCQGRHGKMGDLFLMAGAESKEHRGKEANTPLPKAEAATELAVGEWNTCELICSGDSVKVSVNGQLANETTECTVVSGFIGFQSEGAEIEVRKVFVEPLK